MLGQGLHPLPLLVTDLTRELKSYWRVCADAKRRLTEVFSGGSWSLQIRDVPSAGAIRMAWSSATDAPTAGPPLLLCRFGILRLPGTTV